MKAMVLHEYNKNLLLEEVEDPKLENSDILIKVEGCGMCYTDVKITTGKLHLFVTLPHIPGHEVAGSVVEVGRDAQNIKPGDKGIVYFLIGCRDCDMCRTSNENLCYHITRIGFELPGGYAQYLRLPAHNFCVFNENIPFEEMAVLADAVATPYHALNRLADIRIGQNLLIVGIGGLGIHAVQIAQIMGVHVLAADKKVEALNMAGSYGAELLINTERENPYEKVMEYTKGRGVDIVLEGVGKKETFQWSLPSLKKGGKLVLMGYDPSNPIPINAMDMHNNEWSIKGAKVSTKQELMEVIKLVETGRIKPVVSKKISLNKVNEGLEAIKNARIMGRVTIKMS